MLLRLSRVVLLDGSLKMSVQEEVARNASAIRVSQESRRVSMPKLVAWTRHRLASTS